MDGTRLSGVASAPASAEDSLIGTVLDRRYRVDARIGEGGMARVYRVTHTLIGRVLAVKVLLPELRHDRALVERFLREARCASAVKHPNVVELCDYGELPDGGAFYVMEYLRGRSIADRIDADGPFPPEQAIGIALQICCGLEAIHEQGVVHRDLKAENVFLCPTPQGNLHVKVLDFGVARGGERRLTAAGAILGTPEYMSPEQALGLEADTRSDLYSVGVMLFEMLTGLVPFASEDVALTLESQIRAEPPPLRSVRPDLTAGLVATERVTLRLMAKDREARIQNAATAREELQRALALDLGQESEARVRSTLRLGSNRVAERRSMGPAAPVPLQWEAPRFPVSISREPTTGGGTSKQRSVRTKIPAIVGGVALGTAVVCGGGYILFSRLLRPGVPPSAVHANEPHTESMAWRAEPAAAASVTPVARPAATPRTEPSTPSAQTDVAAPSEQPPTPSTEPAATAVPLPTGAPPEVRRALGKAAAEVTGEPGETGPAGLPPDAEHLPTVDTPEETTERPSEPIEAVERTNSEGDLRNPFGEK